MSRKRVHQVAKEFHISSEALVELLRGMSIDVKSHMSTVDDDTVDRIKRHFEAEKEKMREESARKEKELARRREQQRPVESVDKSKKPQKKKGSFRDRREDRVAVVASVKKTLALMEGGRRQRKHRRRIREDEDVETSEQEAMPVLTLHDETATVGDLAKLMARPASDIIRACMSLGLMATMNQRLDADTIEAVADELGFAVERPSAVKVEDEEDLAQEPRAPVVTVMGHVDHGKTSLLDFIRRTNVVSGEVGGITQHMGAYEVVLPEGRITFIDTPGHEAFTSMRTRGAQATDIVVLVVSASEGVMPQTVEAINHAKAARVPIIVAMSKMDLLDVNPDAVRQQLAGHGVMVEAWGGETIDVPTSARTGEGVDKLLEAILLQAEMMELTAPRRGRASGVVLEAELGLGLGPVATVLVKSGTLRVGDMLVAGPYCGRARVLMDERGARLKEAPPSKAVRVAGIEGVPQAGDPFQVTADERASREVAERRQTVRKQKGTGAPRRATLEDLYRQIREGDVKELRLVVKGDVQGSLEAVMEALVRLGTGEVRVSILHQGIGAITESDVLLASASKAVVIGYHVRPSARAQEVAEREGVEIRTYRVIYECVADIEQALEGMLEPELLEVITGRVAVRRVFHHPKVGFVAGCYVLEGNIDRSSRVRVLRDGVVKADARIGSLKRFKEDVREVQTGYECGIVIENFGDIHEGDVLEAYKTQEVARTLR
ncbi:translation initiation factor IF-2 [Candidatus Fermentibacteria bacterium]|nr:translation initiation factor IF-2 [Candidatus Fermentibacteria bacterium]